MDNLEIADIDIEDIEFQEIDLFELPEDYQETPEQIRAEKQWQEQKDLCELVFIREELAEKNLFAKEIKKQDKIRKLNNFIL